MRQRSKP